MEKVITQIRSLSRTAKYLILIGISIVLIAVILFVILSGSGDVTTSVETSLKEIIESSELRTSQYTYNSIAEVKDNDTTKYHVSYKGTVDAGIDFEDIKIERDGKIIKVIVPEIQIMSVKVDTNMEYIFVKDKYDTEETYAEAYNVCCKDLEEKAKANQTLLITAKESAEDTLMALLKPFEKQLAKGESFEIVFGTNKEGNEQ